MATFRTVISASPQSAGKCAQIAQALARKLHEQYPDDELAALEVPKLDIAPCIGCNRCAASATCFMSDGMDEVRSCLDRSAVLYVVSPVFFAGPPAQFKALLDRLQPYFYTDARTRPRRLAHLVVIGDGGDPYGFAPLEMCMASALSCAGFELARTLPYIGMKTERIERYLDESLFGDESSCAWQPDGQDVLCLGED